MNTLTQHTASVLPAPASRTENKKTANVIRTNNFRYFPTSNTIIIIIPLHFFFVFLCFFSAMPLLLLIGVAQRRPIILPISCVCSFSTETSYSLKTLYFLAKSDATEPTDKTKEEMCNISADETDKHDPLANGHGHMQRIHSHR